MFELRHVSKFHIVVGNSFPYSLDMPRFISL